MAANQSLDELVTVAASHLMGVTANTLGRCIRAVAARTGRVLRRRSGFLPPQRPLRGNDHIGRRMAAPAACSGSRSVRRCPIRPMPTRIFAATEHLSAVMITHPDGADDDYQDPSGKDPGFRVGLIGDRPAVEWRRHHGGPGVHQVR